ncbi:MFS transporter, partial [Streptacidiphilus monticola]
SAPPLPAPGAATRGRSALAVPGVRLLVGALLGVGTVFGALQVSVTAVAEADGRAGLSGVVYGLFATGSVLAGTVFGALRWKASPQRRLLASYTLLVLGCSTLWAMPGLLSLAVAVFCCGLAIAPTMISAYTLVESLVDAGSKTEAFAWLTGSVGLGLALGSTVAGRLADSVGAASGLLVPLTGAGLGLLALLTLRQLLAPAARTVTTRTVASAVPADYDLEPTH